MVFSACRTLGCATLVVALGGVPASAGAQVPASGTGVPSDGGPTGAPSNGDPSQVPSNANVSGGREHQPGQAEVQARENTAGISARSASQQDRDLDAIGKQLLDETPKSPAGTTLQTGGGTTP